MHMTTLVGDRVLLRPVRPTDVARQRRFFQNPELAWLDSASPEAYEEIDVEAFLLERCDSTLRLGIEVNGDYIGFCTLTGVMKPNKDFELGVNIGDPLYWNQGLGKEIVRLLLKHAFQDLGANEVELTTNSKNKRGIRCFLASGFRERNRVRGAIAYGEDRVDMIEMSMNATTWQAIYRS